MSADKYMPDIPDEVIESLAQMILPSIQKYFECEEGQREFTKWKAEKDNKMAETAKTLKPE